MRSIQLLQLRLQLRYYNNASCFVHRFDSSTSDNQIKLYTKLIVLLMSPNTIFLTELSMYGTVFQTLVSQLLVCYFCCCQLAKFDLSSFCVNF